MCFDNVSNIHLMPKMTIGDNIFMGRNTTILCAGEVSIRSNTIFGSYCFVSDENHGIDPSLDKRYECQPLEVSKVIIGQNCWIGEKAMIMPGVTIVDNAIVGAGSIVTKDVPANSMAIGVPARIVKEFDFEEKCWKKI